MADTERELYNQAQRRLISSLIYNSENTSRVFELVNSLDFEEPSFELIFTAITDLARKDESISIMSVAKSLENSGTLQQAGGISELYKMKTEGEKYLLENSAELYASVVREASAKSKMKSILKNSESEFNDDSGISVSDAISNLTADLNERLYSLSDESTMSNLQELANEYVELLEERKRISEENAENAEGLQGIPSLFPTLNKYTHGWGNGQVVTIGARTGVGKTVFAVDAAVAAARAKKSVLFFSLEMSTKELNDRIIACMSGVSQNKLKQGTVNEEELNIVQKTLEELTEMNITVDSDPKQTVDSIRARALKKAQSESGLDFIIIDYLQLITPVGKFGNRQEQVADISRNIKLLAKNLNVPIMILVQLNRAKGEEEEEKMPTLDNIRESAAIAMDSDVVILLHRDIAYDDTTPQTLLILSKNRGGEKDKIIRCHSNLACSLFREIKREKDTEDRLSEDELNELGDDLDIGEYKDDDDFDDDLSIEDLDI